MTDDKVEKKSNVAAAFGYDPNQKLPETPKLNQSSLWVVVHTIRQRATEPAQQSGQHIEHTHTLSLYLFTCRKILSPWTFRRTGNLQKKKSQY